MKTAIEKLRQLIREEVGRLVYLSAPGFSGGSGTAHANKLAGPRPPTLGDEFEKLEDEEYYGKEEEYTQLVPRSDKRNAGKRRQTRAPRHSRRGITRNMV